MRYKVSKKTRAILATLGAEDIELTALIKRVSRRDSFALVTNVKITKWQAAVRFPQTLVIAVGKTPEKALREAMGPIEKMHKGEAK